jgi:hypothetical protein
MFACTVFGHIYDSLLMRNRKKVFFDGLLPCSKRRTRISRITRYTKQLNDYHQAWPQIIPGSYVNGSSRSSDVKLFNCSIAPTGSTRLPAAPFLVPAIIEALSRCERYADLIEVVPGEADLYCADFVKTHGGVVFTGDSDLLLHDLGDGTVCFFKDIDLVTSTLNTSLTCIQYQVGAIIRRLGLEQTHGLLALAFEMAIDTHASFRELLQKAIKLSAVTTHGALYNDFASEYESLQGRLKTQETCNNGIVVNGPSLSRQAKTIDPRISEYLLQFSRFSQTAQLSALPQSRQIGHKSDIDVFLPFLLDCPLRTSAWEMSTSVRQLAYGLVNLVLPLEESVLQVTEYRRLQNGTRSRAWLVPTAQDLPKACTDLVLLFEKMHIATSLLSEKSIWRALAIYQDQELNLGTAKPALSSTLIERSKDGKRAPTRLTWDAIHLFAQFQGSYYSFRMLKQILSIVLLYLEDQSIPLILHQLHVILRSLPTLDEVPSVLDSLQIIGDSDDQIMLKIVQKHLHIQPVAESTKVQKNTNRKKRRTDIERDVSKHAEKASRLDGQCNGGQPKALAKADCRRKEDNNIFEILFSG